MMTRMWTRTGVSRGAHGGTQASTGGNPGRSREAMWVRPEAGSFAYAIRCYRNPAIFRKFEIQADLRAKLLLPFLSVKAKSPISRMNAKELEDYEGVRDFLLSELNSLPESIKDDLIMQPNVLMKRSFTLLRGSEII